MCFWHPISLIPAESVDEVAEITKTQGTIRLETDDVFYGKGAKRKIPEEAELREHIARKSKAIFSLKEPMIDKLQEFEQYHLFTELELPLVDHPGKYGMAGNQGGHRPTEKHGTGISHSLKKHRSPNFRIGWRGVQYQFT